MADRKPRKDDWFICQHCGAEVPADAKVCPECGSDDETGWAEDAHVGSVDIPTGWSKDDEFDYDDFAARELGQRPKRRFGGLLKAILAVLAILILIILFLLLMTPR